jgi:hypothetical protein
MSFFVIISKIFILKKLTFEFPLFSREEGFKKKCSPFPLKRERIQKRVL